MSLIHPDRIIIVREDKQ